MDGEILIPLDRRCEEWSLLICRLYTDPKVMIKLWAWDRLGSWQPRTPADQSNSE